MLTQGRLSQHTLVRIWFAHAHGNLTAMTKLRTEKMLHVCIICFVVAYSKPLPRGLSVAHLQRRHHHKMHKYNQTRLFQHVSNFANTSSTSKPDIIGCLGAPRSGSTLTFNLVRLLVDKIDPNSASGWIDDVVGGQKLKEIIPKMRGHLSVVYKAHDLDDVDVINATDIFILSHRAPFDAICSIGLMFDNKLLLHGDSAVRACHWMRCSQKKIYQAIGNKPAIDMEFDDLADDLKLTNVLQKLTTMLQMRRVFIDFDEIVQRVRLLKPPPKDIFQIHHPKTLLHEHHVHSAEENRACDGLRQALMGDPFCSSWEKLRGRFDIGDTLDCSTVI